MSSVCNRECGVVSGLGQPLNAQGRRFTLDTRQDPKVNHKGALIENLL